MEFLKEILGEELYTQLESKIKEYNGSEDNKNKQVKIGNLGAGEYVNKSDYDALSETLKSKEAELDTANTLIADLKKDGKSDEDLQSKISQYENDIADLQGLLEETRLKSAVKVALLSAHASDVDYLTFKLNEKGEKLELDENGNIKGWEDKLSGLKTQFPKMFESGDNNGDLKVLGDNKLPKSDSGTLTRSEILKKSYSERAALYAENPEAYNEAMNK